MAELPEVVLKEIFDFLGIWERLQVRCTCKKWKFVADALSHQQNVCIYSNSYPYNERWCFSDQRVAEDAMVYLKFDREATRPFNLRMTFFQNLQKVYLFGLYEKLDLFLEEINQLSRLKVLMIEKGRIKTGILNSSSLEKLSLNDYEIGHLQLHTPNLGSLILLNDCNPDNNILNLEFRFPEKVKHLECSEFHRNLAELKSLETLVCISITFDFRLTEFRYLVRAELWSLDAFRTVQNEKKRLNRTNLRVLASSFDEETVAGEPLEIQHFFCRPRSILERARLNLSESFLERADRNQWNLAGSIPWKFDLDVESLVSLRFTSKIPRVFFDKFRIYEISYSKRNSFENEQSALIELIERSKPNTLSASSYRFSRDGVERLSRIQSIKRFYGFCDIESADYLLRLKNLEYLQIFSPKISIDFICKLFKELKFFWYLIFHSSESNGIHLHIDYHNLSPEDAEAEDIEADTLYSLNYRYGPISLMGDARETRDIDVRNLDELIEEVKRMGQDEIVKSFFV